MEEGYIDTFKKSPMYLSAVYQESLGLSVKDNCASNMPWFSLPQGFSFKVTFPFSGAAARFRVRKDSNPEQDVSVYYDTKDVLGFVGKPYWEAYPIGGDIERWARGEEQEMIATICGELERMEKEPPK